MNPGFRMTTRGKQFSLDISAIYIALYCHPNEGGIFTDISS